MKHKKKALFLDRDGVINKNFGYVFSMKNFVWLKNVKKAIKYAYDKGLITDEMVTNLWCPTLKTKLSVDSVTDNVMTKGGNNKTNVFMNKPNVSLTNAPPKVSVLPSVVIPTRIIAIIKTTMLA